MMKHVSLDESSRLGYELFWESAVDARNALHARDALHAGNAGNTVRDNARDSATVALGVVDDKRMCLGVIVEIREGGIGNVKSFELLKLGAPLTLSAESFERLWSALTEHWHALAAL